MTVYLDKDTGEVTLTPPKRARVLVADGQEIPAEVQALLDPPKKVSAKKAEGEA